MEPSPDAGSEWARAAIAEFGLLPGVEVKLERALGQSLTNQLWRVTADGHTWALRLGGSATALGQDCAHERMALRAAAGAGVAPVLLAARDRMQMLQWIEGRTWTDSDLDETGVARIAALLRRAHVPAPAGLPTLGDRIEGMLAWAAARGARVPDHVDAAVRRVRAADGVASVLTHHDVWPNNVLDDGTRLWLVDWEFAGAGDGLYDLATVAKAADLTTEGQHALLMAYGSPNDIVRLDEARWSVGLFEGAWALAMHTVRDTDSTFDYADYAAQMFAGLLSSPSDQR